jgi:hypothetical protein
MLDVHAPEHPIHGVREFFIHLFTITVGLLIALGLENLAEWRHHVHIKHEAEANIRREIAANQKDVRAVIAAIPEEQNNLQVVVQFLQERIDNKQPTIHALKTGLMEATLQDASWNTATSTGALSYMDYGEVERFSSAYQLQKKFDAQQEQALPSIVSLMAAIGTSDPTKMSSVDAAATLRDVRMIMAHMQTVNGFAVDVDKLYDAALKGE